MKATKMVEVLGGFEIPPVSRAMAAPARLSQDGCVICSGPAEKNCESCDRRFCNRCEVRSELLPLSCLCSSDCRDEAEFAAEQARQTDLDGCRR
jgi:hypothetical protein